MNNRFDELAKALAQPVPRRAALKKFGVGAAVALLAAFGLAPRAEAGNRGYGEPCTETSQCQHGLCCVGGVCSTSGGPWSICASDADCANGLVCRITTPWGTYRCVKKSWRPGPIPT